MRRVDLKEDVNEAREEIKGMIRRIGIRRIPFWLPNAITVGGVFVTLWASYYIATGHFSAAFIVFIASQFMDTMDGAFAKEFGLTSTAGAFFDSTVDRITEFMWYIAFAYYFYKIHMEWVVFLLFTAMFFAFLISYTRARIEGLGEKCEIGFFQRVFRIYFMSAVIVAMIYSVEVAIGIICIMLVLSIFTSIQRFVYGMRVLKDKMFK